MFRKSLLLFFFLNLVGCSIYYKAVNKQVVERLNNQFKQEKYDEMYQLSSDILKRSISKEEFISVAREMRVKMQDVDEDFIWQKGKKISFDKDLFRDDNFSYRVMSKNERALHIQINWNTSFRLCSLSVYRNPNESSGIGFRYCD